MARWFSTLVVFWLSIAVLLPAGCGEVSLHFTPPLLMSTAGLSAQVELHPEAMGFGDNVTRSFSTTRPFVGHIFGAVSSAEVSFSAEAFDSGSAPSIALYGPRNKNGLFNSALVHASANTGEKALVWDFKIPASGDYLILVADAAGQGGNYRLLLDCSTGCNEPACAPIVCGLYCPVALARDDRSCPLCDCAPGCESDADCSLGYSCVNGTCRTEDPCQCDKPYEPVCGVDRRTYANMCELDCAGVDLDHEGECQQFVCTTDSDCAIGMICVDGECIAACDCSGESYDPVCGTDGTTYANECERQCADVGLAHLGSCEECSQEVCDGIDNDCDGLVDEGVCNDCETDDDCPAGMYCQNSSCVGSIACAANDDCPVGQVCIEGICRLDEGCVPEICDGVDNDCDGQTDEGCAACNSDSDCAQGQVCENGVCTIPSCTDADGDGFCPEDGDCDDADALIYPGATELCDELDNDCDGRIDEDFDFESDPQNCGGCGNSCEAGEACINGTCTEEIPCTTADDCDDGNPGTVDFCANGGYCIHVPTCITDSDCEEAQMCYDDICLGSGPCASDSDCNAGWLCVNGVCALPCRTNSECEEYQVCIGVGEYCAP